MFLGIKKLDDRAIIPIRANPGDAGLDITAIDMKATHDYIEYQTGLAFEIPEGHVGLLFPRSSVTTKELYLGNSVGVIDSGYRGEVTFRFKCTSHSSMPNVYKSGDRIGQLVVIPISILPIVELTELSETQRGTGGYGSSGT